MEKRVEEKPRRKMGPGLSRVQFSEMSDIPIAQVDRMIKAGKLRIVEIGTMRRIPYSELERIQAELGPTAAQH